MLFSLAFTSVSMQVDATRSKGEPLGEISFFFRLRHLYTTVVGPSTTTLFKLAYDDYKELAASYVDDAEHVIEQMISQVEGGAQDGKSASASHVSGDSILSNAAGAQSSVTATITAAIKRKSSQLVATFLEAVAENSVARVNAMLESGKVGADDMDENRRTALHIAAGSGHLELCTVLLRNHGATVDVHDCTGASPLDAALASRQSAIADLLTQQYGSRVAASGAAAQLYMQRLMCATQTDDKEYVDMLVRAGVDINSRNTARRTPLHIAVVADASNVLSYFLEQPEVQLGPLDSHNHTPLWDALLARNAPVALKLRLAGAPLQVCNQIVLCFRTSMRACVRKVPARGNCCTAKICSC